MLTRAGDQDSKVRRLIAALGLAAALATPAAAQNLLGNPSFESNVLQSHTTILNNFALWQGTWGVDAASSQIVTAQGCVTAPHASRMLRLGESVGAATSAWQVTDVGSMFRFIDTGLGRIDLRAQYNTVNVPAAHVFANARYFSAPDLATETLAPCNSAASGGPPTSRRAASRSAHARPRSTPTSRPATPSVDHARRSNPEPSSASAAVDADEFSNSSPRG